MSEFSTDKRLSRSLTSDNLWLYFLSILARRRIHSYAMAEEVEKRFGFRPGLIMGYVVLYRLEAEGLVSARQEGKRKYYSITPKGRQSLAAAKRTLRELAGKL